MYIHLFFIRLQTYKHLSSFIGWSLPQITQSVLLEFAISCPGLIEKGFENNDVIIQHKAVKINAKLDDKLKNSKNVPDNVIRHEFMGVLVKIANNKYLIRNKLLNTLMEAVTTSFEKHFLPSMNKYLNIHNFRITRYYNEAVDNTIKAYLPIFDGVYIIGLFFIFSSFD